MFTKCKTIKYITCLLDEFIPEKEQRFKLKTKRDSTNDKKYVVRGVNSSRTDINPKSPIESYYSVFLFL